DNRSTQPDSSTLLRYSHQYSKNHGLDLVESYSHEGDQVRRKDYFRNIENTDNVIPVLGSTSQPRLTVTGDPIYDLTKGYTPLVDTHVKPQPVHIYVTTDRLTTQGQPTAQASHIPPLHTDEEL
ncbi:hypothetical protein RYX36_011429, partial [Vicia faba]